MKAASRAVVLNHPRACRVCGREVFMGATVFMEVNGEPVGRRLFVCGDDACLAPVKVEVALLVGDQHVALFVDKCRSITREDVERFTAAYRNGERAVLPEGVRFGLVPSGERDA